MSLHLVRCVSLLVGLGVLIGMGGPVQGEQAVSYSGRATVVRATVLGESLVFSDTGSLPASGGAQDASLLTLNVPGVLSAEVLHAATIGQGDRSRSEASVANVNLTVGGNTISAGFLMARAMAKCAKSRASVSGSSEIAALAINGIAISVTGKPNQTVLLPNGKVVINEQTSSVANGTGEITVNALHVIVTDVADVVISSAHADIVCGPVVNPGGDFVTGGGFITASSNAKGNFGVAGGIKNQAFWGHLTYIDHGTGMHVQGTGVTAYAVVNSKTRHIEGTCNVDGQAGFTYAVDVADHGEPGRKDTFSLTVSNGYAAKGTLAGGNIQLHIPSR
jgi:hypothetical protein